MAGPDRNAPQGGEEEDEDAGMGRNELKRLFKYAQKDPVSMALAIGEDGKPILQLDRRRQPRALLKQLLDDAGDVKDPRFGTVAVSDDRRTAVFTLNKPAGGLRRKLIVALKGTGITNVEIPD